MLNGGLSLSQSNQVLINNNYNNTDSLFNVNTGATSTLYQLFPSALLQQLSGSFGGQPILLQAFGIDDRGDLLVTAGPGNGPWQEAETFLLTPPAWPHRLRHPSPPRS
jgi:hypothetical protein